MYKTHWKEVERYFMRTCVSVVAKTLDEPCPDVGADAERSAASNPSVETLMVISLFELDIMWYLVNREVTLIDLGMLSAVLQLTIVVAFKTHDQTCIPPSLASPVQMMRMSCSANLMIHRFWSFSMAWTISTARMSITRAYVVHLRTDECVNMFDVRTKSHRYF